MLALNKEIATYPRTYFFTKDTRPFKKQAFMYERNQMIFWDGFFQNVASYAFVI